MTWNWTYEFEADYLGTVRYSTVTEEWTLNGKVEGRMSRELANALTDLFEVDKATVTGFEAVPSPSNPTEKT